MGGALPAGELYFYRARYYGPVVRRFLFLSEDPIGLAGGINVYAYVNGSPLMYTDPLEFGNSVTMAASKKFLFVGGAIAFAVAALVLFDESFERKKLDRFSVAQLLHSLSATCGKKDVSSLPSEFKVPVIQGRGDAWVLIRDGASTRYEYRGASSALKTAVVKLKFEDGTAGCEVDTSGVSSDLVAPAWKGATRLPLKQ